MKYIKRSSCLSTRCAKENYNSFTKVLIQAKQHKSTKTLVDAQTKQWVRPPTMIIWYKSNIRLLRPPEREHLDFVQQMMHGTSCIFEQAVVFSVPHDPHAG
jgi:hypothetical protein